MKGNKNADNSGNAKRAGYHHFTIGERRIIETRLDENASFTAIAAELDVSTSTVAREVKRNRRWEGPSYSANRYKNDCIYITNCKQRNLCGKSCGKKLCHTCAEPCHTFGCPEYKPRICTVHRKAPWVCNGCRAFAYCIRERVRYSAETAQVMGSTRYADARCGIDLTPEEMQHMVKVVRKGLMYGQSIHHIFTVNDLPASERSFYRYVENADVPIISLELPKKVRYKKRKASRDKDSAATHEKDFYEGRTFEDYLSYMRAREESGAACICAQGDTVLGARPGKARLLTIHRPDLHFQFYLKMPDGTKESTVAAFDWLERCCVDPETGEEWFSRIFPAILFDRGSEFDDIEGIERSIFTPAGAAEPAKRCRAFFADPRRPDQKGAAEKNHVELRKLLPKGTPFDHLSASDVADIASRVNSTVRKSLGNATPFSLAKRSIPQFVFDNLGLAEIDAKEVRLRIEEEDIPF